MKGQESLFQYVHMKELSTRSRPFSEYLFEETCHRTKSLHSKDLISSSGSLSTLELSSDGKFFVTGGTTGQVLLWSINEALSYKPKSNLIVMPTRHTNCISTVAISPNNRFIFSGGSLGNVSINEVQTYFFIF